MLTQAQNNTFFCYENNNTHIACVNRKPIKHFVFMLLAERSCLYFHKCHRVFSVLYIADSYILNISTMAAH